MAIEDQFKKINALQKQILKLEPDPVIWNQDYLEKVKVDFTYASNNLEGNKISHGQTVQILKDFVSPKDTSISDYLDILNHKKVLDLVFENYQSERITESNIKKLHKELMKNPAQWADDTYCDPGKYKIFENRTYRSDGKEHLYAAPEEVQTAIELLIRETNEALNFNSTDIGFHPLSIATRFHFVFLNHIHPFGDGNGRIARIFMNLILLQKGFPPIFIKEVNKRDYLECFTEEEKHPGAMLEFMTARLIESLKLKKKHLLASLSEE
ncbi:Fic family protein [Pedobacter sp. AW31-3R]|uniref:Fic family protein n=1 Tax=Pedobacter sp. AW31-3R TaxID=3445781 RepID=UPI003FA068E5